MSKRKVEDMTEPELAALMRGLGDGLKMICETVFETEAPLFVLILFNDPKVAQYIATCSRTDAIEAMRETAARLASKQTIERVPFPKEPP